ncbi:MAG: hypothetical protein Q8L78_03780 [Coxiellaceae bacterium]|nr:hypothetical protein [Coxiellaceae bacterium]
MDITIKFDSAHYKPILLSDLLKLALKNFSYSGNMECFDDPIFFKEAVRFSFLREKRTLFLSKFIPVLVDAILTILFYTYEHLSSRKYNGFAIAELAVIEDIFLEIILMLDKIIFYENKIQVMEQCVFILKQLGQLGGARAILKNNAIELMTSLKFLIKYLEL